MDSPKRHSSQPVDSMMISPHKSTTGSFKKPYNYLESPARNTRQQSTQSTTPILQRTYQYSTPPPPRAQRREPSTSVSKRRQLNPIAKKKIYFIRHGQSLAQVASVAQRKSDLALQDCRLSNQGILQAKQLRTHVKSLGIQLVVASPLTRAIQTALLAFPTTKTIVHYELRELGSAAIENQPRPIHQVLADLDIWSEYTTKNLDVTTFQPHDWPHRHDVSPRVVRRDRVRQVFEDWLADRPETVVAVVCHYHVIRAALYQRRNSICLGKNDMIKPLNCVPIHCELDEEARLTVVRVMEETQSATQSDSDDSCDETTILPSDETLRFL
jgi:broad specificity phosphatase PhoE